MYKYYLIKTNRVTLRKSINYFKSNLIDEEEIVSPRPLPQMNITSNIIYIKVKENSKNHKKTISFNQHYNLSKDEYINKIQNIEYKW